MKSRINKLKYTFEISDGSSYYYRNNKLHRHKDLPSIIWEDGSKIWFKNGKNHRDNGKPSCIYPDGRMYWYKNGNFIKSNYNEIENK